MKRLIVLLPLMMTGSTCEGDDPIPLEPINPYVRQGVFSESLCATDGNLQQACRPIVASWVSENPWVTPESLGMSPSTPLQNVEPSGELPLDGWYNAILDQYVGYEKTARGMEPCREMRQSTLSLVRVSSPGSFLAAASIITKIIKESLIEFKATLDEEQKDLFELHAEVEFSDSLQKTLQDKYTTTASLYYVRLEPRVSYDVLQGDVNWAQCVGEVSTAVTGAIVQGASFHRAALLTVDIKQLFSASVSGNAALDENTKTKFSAKLTESYERTVKLEFAFDFTSSNPIFYPYWVRVESLDAPSNPAEGAPECLNGDTKVNGTDFDDLVTAANLCDASLDDLDRPILNPPGWQNQPLTSEYAVAYWNLNPAVNSGNHNYVTCECVKK